ncbi:terminase large subunit [Salmonella phage PKM.Hi.22.6]|nr:MAG: terminase large subunit [Caudoviricetes sp.]UYL17138.1 MAG: terminase large subunit [Caudoviricetes sp.]WKV17055.1 terminase large subunit [Salmonella phage PKM.Hi.22.6]
MDFNEIDLDSLPEHIKWEIIDLLEERERVIKYNRINEFEPYEFQKNFYSASAKFKRRFLCAANRVGKSYSEAVEVFYHLSGLYPEWWDGHRFKKPILLWAVGITGDSTRKVLQKELFGTPMGKDQDALGTGAIPRDLIDIENIEKDGNIIKIAKVKHHDKNGDFDGWSTLEFRSTQQGEHVLMGATVDYIWLDEEDPFKSMEIYAQCVTRTATTGGLITITATPENGLTKLVDLFMKDMSGYLYFQNATWDDAPHLDEETKKELLASIPTWQHEMRSRGIPMMGEGLIYDIAESSIITEPIEIPSHWRRLAAVDIGISHDTAVVWTAYDAATDCIYVYDCYSADAGVPAMHATAINARGNWIPVILPHDADNTERGSGRSVASYYAEAGVNVMPETFYNPLDWTGKKNNFVEPGIMEILQRMKTGRFKVFSTCGKFFEEMRRYHRKDGKIVKEFDDTMDAARYSALSVIGRGVSAGEASAGYNAAFNDNWNYNY